MTRRALAIDLGGTKLRAGVVDAEGKILGVARRETPQSRDALLVALESAAQEALGEAGATLDSCDGVGIGTAGVIDPEGGRVVYAPNLPLEDFALGTEFQRRTRRPCRVENDGRVAALGEYRFGELAGLDPMVCLFFGTGIGIGMVQNGELVRGADNAAGEVGHTILSPEGPLCHCGKRGCFEALAGGRHLTERAAAEIGPRPGGYDVGDVVALAASGNANAAHLLDDAARAAAIMTGNLITLLNPRALVMGGGVLSGWPGLYHRLLPMLPSLCHASVLAKLRIVRSKLDADVQLLGATALVLR